MARKLAVTVTVSVLFLFTLANARVPLDLPRNYVPTLGDTKTSNTILLPRERPDTEPETVLEIEPEKPEPETIKSSEDGPVEFKESTETPLTVTSFRPINRRYFPRRLPFGRHSQHRRFKPWDANPGSELSYENDMIEEKQWAGRFQIRGRPRYRDDDVASWRDQDEMRMFRPHHRFHRHHRHRRHHHHRDNDEVDLEEKEERHHEREGEEEDGGIFKGIRKFLNHF